MTKKQQEQHAEKFTIMCNLIETLWLQRKAKDYHTIDLDNLANLTSPQARRVAMFIMQTLEV